MEYKNIVVAGGGVLGSQIAFQTAYSGYNTTIWLRSEGSIGRTEPKVARLKQIYLNTLSKDVGTELDFSRLQLDVNYRF